MRIFLDYFFGITRIGKNRTVSLVIVMALIIGLLWEVYEIYFGLTFFSDGIIYVRDTASDLILDTCGGFFGALYSYRFLVKR